MALLRRTIEVRRTLGGGRLQILKTVEIEGDYFLCSIENPSPIAVIASSVAVLSIGEIRLPVSPTSIIKYMEQYWNPRMTAQPTSVYSLSQAA